MTPPSQPHVVGVSTRLRDLLAAQGTPERAAGERRYLKSTLTHLGAGMPAVRRTTTQVLREARLDLPARLALADALWAQPVHELRRAAVEVLALSARDQRAQHLDQVERYLREARTWALVDPLSTAVAGVIAIGDPAAHRWFARWITDGDLWVRRAALLVHLPVLRADLDGFARFAAAADHVLDEREFFIRKAIGWVLRDVARRAPDLVVAWLEPRTGRASGVTMREAVRYLPDTDAQRLMAAYRAAR